MTSLLTESSVNTFFEDHPEIQWVEVLLPDISGIFRGKRMHRDALKKLYQDGMRIASSIYMLDTLGQNCSTIPYGSTDGDPDRAVFGVEGTLCTIPWQERPTAQLIGTMVEDDGTPFFADPRQVLARCAKQFTDMGLTPVTAIELEFYLLDPKLGRDGAPRPARVPDLGSRTETVQVYSLSDIGDFDDVLAEIEDACLAQGLPANVTTSEYAPGQFEINLNHVDDVVRACDEAVLFKRVVKEVARCHGMVATFMAKPFAEQAGNGMHVHVSLVDGDGRNIFIGSQVDDETEMPIDIGLKHAIGGLRETMAEAMAVFAPNGNSYRRFRTDSYAPVNRAWGINNRSVSLRIPHSDPAGFRVEHRAAGADANPYLVTAAVLAGMHHGITNKVDPGPIERGNAYDRPTGKIPLRWEPALRTFAEGTVLKDYWGHTYHDVFHKVRQHEADLAHDVIPRHEYDWYMRIV